MKETRDDEKETRVRKSKRDWGRKGLRKISAINGREKRSPRPRAIFPEGIIGISLIKPH